MVSETKTTEAPGLRRELKARHLTMIAIGGSIGTGLFVASGATISQAGPGGALLSYMLIGLMVYFLMTSLGELAAYMPVSGSFATYGQNYVEEGFGFALGWNYWYNWAVTIAVDLVAAQLVMSWWFPDTPGWIWSALFLGVIFLLNYISVRGFGEAEYWFSLIKVTTVIVFIIVGVLMIIGIFKGAQPAGWSNWTIGEAPFAGGFAAMIGVAMIVGFSPVRPVLVVMNTTPFAAREPYIAVAEASFMTVMFSMSLAFSAVKIDEGTGLPSSTNRGSVPALIEFTPRIRIEIVSLGSPEFDHTCSPAICPWRASPTLAVGAFWSSFAPTVVAEPVMEEIFLAEPYPSTIASVSISTSGARMMSTRVRPLSLTSAPS